MNLGFEELGLGLLQVVVVFKGRGRFCFPPGFRQTVLKAFQVLIPVWLVVLPGTSRNAFMSSFKDGSIAALKSFMTLLTSLPSTLMSLQRSSVSCLYELQSAFL